MKPSTRTFGPRCGAPEPRWPHMIEQHNQSQDGVGGNIVTIATHALVGLNRVPYAFSKGGIIGLTTSVSKEVGRYGIRINCVAPSANSGKVTVYPRNYRLEHVEFSDVPEEALIEQPVDAEGEPGGTAAIARAPPNRIRGGSSLGHRLCCLGRRGVTSAARSSR